VLVEPRFHAYAYAAAQLDYLVAPFLRWLRKDGELPPYYGVGSSCEWALRLLSQPITDEHLRAVEDIALNRPDVSRRHRVWCANLRAEAIKFLGDAVEIDDRDVLLLSGFLVYQTCLRRRNQRRAKRL
jgi:hypothetical protein